jgi:hypothetical protein
MPTCVRGRAIDARDAEVGDLQHALTRHDQVRRLDVPVHHAAACANSSAFRSWSMSSTSCAKSNATRVLRYSRKPGALDVLHRDEGNGVVLAVLVDADDVGMVQPARGLRLVLEARHVLRGELRLDQALADGLDRYQALDVRIERLVDRAHRALAQGAPDLVLAEAFGIAHVFSAAPRVRKRAPPGRPKALAPGGGGAERRFGAGIPSAAGRPKALAPGGGGAERRFGGGHTERRRAAPRRSPLRGGGAKAPLRGGIRQRHASAFQHLHRLHETRLHPAHRLGQHTDLVLCCGS